MTKEKASKAEPKEPPQKEQQVYIPKPPSPEAVEEISRQQALITDEWTGEKQPGKNG